jgi:predicted transcriptional regulator
MMAISAAESLVMEALWRREPLTAEEIFAEVAGGQGWAEGTLKTLLARLHKKGAVSAEKDGRRFLYRPLLTRGDYVETESQGLLDRLFDGELAPLVAHYARHRALSSEEVTRLKRLIAELDADDQ